MSALGELPRRPSNEHAGQNDLTGAQWRAKHGFEPCQSSAADSRDRTHSRQDQASVADGAEFGQPGSVSSRFCPMCLGRGSSAHVLTRQCSMCNGIGSLRIAVHPDDTGIAPNWARFQAILTDEYDGAATGRAGAVGCGQTPDEAIADLIERLG